MVHVNYHLPNPRVFLINQPVFDLKSPVSTLRLTARTRYLTLWSELREGYVSSTRIQTSLRPCSGVLATRIPANGTHTAKDGKHRSPTIQRNSLSILTSADRPGLDRLLLYMRIHTYCTVQSEYARCNVDQPRVSYQETPFPPLFGTDAVPHNNI